MINWLAVEDVDSLALAAFEVIPEGIFAQYADDSVVPIRVQPIILGFDEMQEIDQEGGLDRIFLRRGRPVAGRVRR